MTEQAVVTEREDQLALVRLNRPSVHNALNAAALDDLHRRIAELAQDGRTRAIVLTGTGEKAFSAGADLDELAELAPETAYDVMRTGQRVLRAIELAEIPVIAAVNGVALGGGFELVLASTFPLLSQRASLGLPETGLGLIPGYGGTQRLARVVGAPVASHMMLTGRRMNADRAYALGLTPLPPVEPDRLLDTAREVAGEVIERGPRACRAVLHLVRTGAEAPLDVGLALESSLASLSIAGTESTTGITAFQQKRPPRFDQPEDGS